MRAWRCGRTLGTGWVVFLTISCVLQNATAQDQADGRPDRSAEPDQFQMLTAWGEAVTAQNAWREYPRPGLTREQWLSLNGHWDFAIVGEPGRWTAGRIENAKADPLLRGMPAPPTDWPLKILVPFSPETQLSGITRSIRPNQLMWYRRTFQVPDAWTDQRILLHFEAVDWHCLVLLNGKQVGENQGGYVPFTCDLTEALRPAGSQELMVVAWDPTNMGDQTIGKQALPELRRGFRYTPNSGIWQSVWLEPVPNEAHIGRLRITPVPHERAIDIAVDVVATPNDPSNDADATLTVRVEALGESLVVTGTPERTLRMQFSDDCAFWSPQAPNLHPLRVELCRGKTVIDRVESYYALRTIDFAADAQGLNRVRLNGEPLFQFGPLDQGYWPGGALTPPSEDAVRYDLKYLKDIGCNMVRVHIKVHPRRWYYEADRLGLLVWQDFVCTRKFDSKITPASAAQWELEQRRMIDHLQNHPSVIMWVVFNEGWGQYDTERLTKWAQAYDPSRLVTCASGWTDYPVGDIYDNHDYSFNVSPAHGGNFPDRATLCGEAGGFNTLIPGHLWHSNQTLSPRVNPAGETGRENYDSVAQWEPRYRTWLTNLRLMRSGGLNAVVYTQISDVEHECNGWLTYDRRVSKFPVEQLRRWHRRLSEPLHTNVLLDLSHSPFVHHVGKPPEGWAGPGFDAGGWSTTPKPQIDALTPPVPVAQGQGPLCLRSRLSLSDIPEQLAMHTIGSARQWQLWINGEQIMNIANSDRAGYVPYCRVLLPDSARRALRKGDNVIALRLIGDRQAGPALVDFALLDVEATRDDHDAGSGSGQQ